jgi:uncharacterized membrane protein HdeD (DUF308 family)|tara:strand:+ start:77 stop:277 length:201 start_codon:yes stop_codon:yes gene_type:complete
MSNNRINEQILVSPIFGLVAIVFGIFMIRIALAYTITTISIYTIIFGILSIILGIFVLLKYNNKEV